MRVVFDTNIYIAAALNPGKYTFELLETAGQGTFELFSSEPVFTELVTKLIEKRYQGIDEYVSRIRKPIKFVRPTEQLQVVKADPDDNKILECAVEARADLIITMDKHLLRLKQFRGMGIAHPSDMKYILQDES